MDERINNLKEKYLQEMAQEMREIASLEEEAEQVERQNLLLDETVRGEWEKPHPTLLPYPPPLVPVNPSQMTHRVEPMLPPLLPYDNI